MVWPWIWAVTPTVVVGLVFWLVMRSIVRADRSERSAYARVEAEERARRSQAEGLTGADGDHQ